MSGGSAKSRRAVDEVRRIVRRAVPAAEETTSYGMRAFRLGRIFLYVGGFKSHVGIYPPVRGDRKLMRELSPYRGPKGNLKFPLDEPLPRGLVTRVARGLSKSVM